MKALLRTNLLQRAWVGLLLCVALLIPSTALAGDRDLFIHSAVEHGDNTATLPLYRGTSQGREVFYVVLDASDGNAADNWGVNRSDKLNNARNTAAVQKVQMVNGVINFPASVDFAPNRVVVPGPTGFPPAQAEPGSVGEAGYSPLIELPNGVILNAPQIGNNTGWHDKVASVDLNANKVTLRESDGFQGGKAVKYISTDASIPLAAALEGSTLAPALDAAPFAGGDGSDSARASLIAFVNGQTGINNPQRQGLNSALLDGADPLNVLSWNPKQGRYSPLWDIFPAAWSAQAIASGQNVRQDDFGDIENLVQKGKVTGPGGAAFGPGGFIVNCPIVSSD